jgi:hypothetical protein
VSPPKVPSEISRGCSPLYIKVGREMVSEMCQNHSIMKEYAQIEVVAHPHLELQIEQGLL